jgi:hypothetical protein
VVVKLNETIENSKMTKKEKEAQAFFLVKKLISTFFIG